MNEVLIKRLAKHKQSLDFRHSNIRRLGELKNILVGEVSGIYDTKSYCFIVKENIISISDLLDKKNTAIEFTYNITSNTYKGTGIRNHYKDCERLVCYVLTMVQNLNENSVRKSVH